MSSYEIVTNYFSGPLRQITQDVTLQLDTNLGNSPSPVLNYSSSAPGTSYDLSNVQYESLVSGPHFPFSPGLPDVLLVQIGGPLNGINLPVAGTFDFLDSFYVNIDNGDVTQGYNYHSPSVFGSYSTAQTVYDTFGGGQITVSLITSSVPETSTWFMMIFGFGIVGFMLRKHKLRSWTLPTLKISSVLNR